MARKEVYKGFTIESSPLKLKDTPGTFSPHGFITYSTGDADYILKPTLHDISDEKWICNSEDEAHELFIESAKKDIDSQSQP